MWGNQFLVVKWTIFGTGMPNHVFNSLPRTALMQAPFRYQRVQMQGINNDRLGVGVLMLPLFAGVIRFWTEFIPGIVIIATMVVHRFLGARVS